MNLLRKFNFLYSPDPDGKEGGGDKKEKEQKGDKESEQQDVVALAKALKELKENSVPKSEYEKLEKVNKGLVDEVINGGGESDGETPPEQADIAKLRDELYGSKCSELSNLEFWKKTLELRKAVIDKDGYDPFLPYGDKIKPTAQDQEKAELVASVVQECIDDCDGDSEVFTALLQSKTNNDSASFTAHLKQLGIKFK